MLISKPTFVPDSTLEEIPPAKPEDVQIEAQGSDSSLEEFIRHATARSQTPPEENPRT